MKEELQRLRFKKNISPIPIQNARPLMMSMTESNVQIELNKMNKTVKVFLLIFPDWETPVLDKLSHMRKNI